MITNDIELFEKLLSFRSVTPYDDGLFDFVDEYMGDKWHIVKLDFGVVKNRVYTKKFSDKALNLCFAGHIDVVPAGDGWSSDPFVPIEKDGTITARGTQDMKSGVASMLYACKNIAKFDGTITILLTSDEEGDAVDGTVRVLEHMKTNSILPDFAVVAEPTCEKIFGDTIKIGRRGSINGYLDVQGVQGHAAYPQKAVNPIDLIAPILSQISNKDLDNGDEFFAPSKLVITDIRAGMEATNVTPNNLKLMLNVRNSTKTDQKDVRNLIDGLCDNLNYKFHMTQGSYPFVTNKGSYIVKKLQKSIKHILNIDTNYSTAGGTSDARFFASFDVDVVEFGVINDKIHSVNESTTIYEVSHLTKVFEELINEF